MYNFNHLYYFYMVAKLEGITKAAERLNTSQPSLSYQIKTLEEQLQKKLFAKKGRTLHLTEDGQIVYNYCRRMFEVAEEMDDYLKGSSPSRGGHLRIGVTPDIERLFIADIIGSTVKSLNRSDLPRISMVLEDNDGMASALKAENIDVLITHTPTYDEEFEVVLTINMPIGLVAQPKLADRLGLNEETSVLDNLRKAQKKLILPSNKLKLRQEIDLYLQRKKIHMHMTFESDMLASMARLAADGLGVSFLPIPYIKNDLKRGSLKIYPYTKVGLWQHKLSIIVRRNKRKSFFVEQLIQNLKDS